MTAWAAWAAWPCRLYRPCRLEFLTGPHDREQEIHDHQDSESGHDANELTPACCPIEAHRFIVGAQDLFLIGYGALQQVADFLKEGYLSIIHA